MDIVVYSPLSFRYGGGFERSFMRLLPHLRALDIRCNIFCPDFLAGEAQRLTPSTIASSIAKSDSTYQELEQTTIHRVPIPHMSGLAALVQAVRNADAVYWNNAYALQDIIGSILSRVGTPIISGYHASLFSDDLSHNRYVSSVTLPLAKCFAATHVLNSEDEMTLKRWKAKRIFRIPPGIDTAQFRPSVASSDDEIFKVLFVGRLVEQKGISILVDVIKITNSRGHSNQIEFNIAGTGPLSPLVDDIAKRVNNVRVLGHVDDSSLKELYSTCHVLIMPSLRETFGNVALEALACGLPVIGFQIQGLRDFVRNGIDGILTINKGASEMFDSLEKIFVKWRDHIDEFALMKKAARQNALRFDIVAIGTRFAGMIKEATGWYKVR
jgi:glycosyltransferase involved in cell wall biosynthesis